MKIFLCFMVAVFAVKNSLTQTRNEAWFKFNLYTKVSSNFAVSVDINLRQQANYIIYGKNIFQLPLMRSSRLWLFYNLPNNYTIIATVFAAKTFDIKNKQADLLSASETQLGIGLSKKIMLNKTESRNRLLAEKREVRPKDKPVVNQFRYRLQNSLTVPVKTFSPANKINFVVTNEVFFKTQQSFTSFDQNRTACLAQWHYRHCEYNIGFQKTFQRQSNNPISKNQLLLVFNYSL